MSRIVLIEPYIPHLLAIAIIAIISFILMARYVKSQDWFEESAKKWRKQNEA